MAQSPPSRRRLYQTSRRHPRTYILTSSNSSPRDTHLRIFSRLSTSSLTIPFTLALPTSTVTPTPKPPSDPDPRVTYPAVSSRLSTNIYTVRQAVEPHLHRHPYSNIRSRSLSSQYPPYDFFRLSTSNLTFLEAVEFYLQRHPYTNIGFRFPSAPYLPYDFFPPLSHNFNSS